uniref:Lipase domain-containing protein n=1 Tax=Stomoxys calcitrans TaxID=35570 RepID=A0A1I8PUE8_STOCA
MKLFLNFLLIGVIISTSAASILSNLLGNTLNTVSGTVKELTSDVADAGCRLFAETVKDHPIKDPTIEDVSFQLITPCGRKEFPVSSANQLSESPEFDRNKTTVVFITGWLVEPDMDYIQVVARAFHCREDYNFVLVNTGGVITNLYINSAYHTGKLGEFVAMGLQNLGIPTQDIYLVGHSLGAQIAGSAGRYFHNLTNEKLLRITGLDPARPCFLTPIVFPRIGKGDAEFIDIIHTNPTDLGIEEAIGDADFYAGGLDVIKPGCSRLTLLCSHERAIFYFAESVYPQNENNFLTKQCNNMDELLKKKCMGPNAFMGLAADPNIRGIYSTEVRDKSPYGTNASSGSSAGLEECGVCSQKNK